MKGKWWLPVGIVVLLAVAVVAFVVAGSRGSSGPPSQRLQSWVQASGLGQAIGTLTGDNRSVDQALAAHQDTTSIHTVCAVLANEAQTANQNLPSPDTAVTDTLARAFALEYDAGEACYKAGATGTKLLAESHTDRTRAEQLFAQVLRRVRRVTGQSLPTTTTTSPGSTSTTFL